MDEFNFDEFLDILNIEPQEPLPVAPAGRDGIILPQGVKWAQEDYPYSALVKMPHLTTIAYHITSVELKHVNSKWGNLLVLESHVNCEMKIWQFKDDGKLNSIFATIATVVKAASTEGGDNFWRGSWVLIRQTLNYGKFIASKYQTFCRTEDIKHAAYYVEDSQSWEERELMHKAARAEANYERYEDAYTFEEADWHPGHPSNYGDK